jgi:hypothetical protein
MGFSLQDGFMNWMRALLQGLRKSLSSPPPEVKLLRLLESQEEQLSSLPLAQYVTMIADVPLPTQEQKENFVEYVSHAHSWYKHLPLYPGVPFHFFLDKYAGCDRVLLFDGTMELAERTQQGFHYSDIPTREYRARFGHLAFSCGAGTTVVAVGVGRGPTVARRDKMPAVPDREGRMWGFPSEILEAGGVSLTGTIHARSMGISWWDRLRPGDWPPESGGQATLMKIFARSREMRQPGFRRDIRMDEHWRNSNPGLAGFLVDSVLYDLIFPEQRRQQKQASEAINRVCGVIEANRAARS